MNKDDRDTYLLVEATIAAMLFVMFLVWYFNAP